MYHSQQQRDNARKLRREMTDAERKLWYAVRKRQLCDCRFRRQYGLGPYIVDFECFDKKLVVELDGGQHNSTEGRAYDKKRSEYLASAGYRVVRFWNDDVMDDLDNVLEVIARMLMEQPTVVPPDSPSNHPRKDPHPGPPPEGEGE